MAKPLASIEVMRAAAIEFLRYGRKCRLVCLERSPFAGDPCTPDVVGVTPARRVVEIEIKRTMADFRHNREKTSLFKRGFLGMLPSQFYFMVPEEMVSKVLPLLEPKEGLLSLSRRRSTYSKLPLASVVKAAAVIKESRPLRLSEMVKAVSHQTGTLVSALVKIAKTFDEQPLSEDDIEKSSISEEKPLDT